MLLLPHLAAAQSARIKRIDLHPVEIQATEPKALLPVPIPKPVLNEPGPLATTVHMPLASYRITSRFGWRKHPISGKPDFHNGIDLAARAQVVRNIMDGTVEATGYHKNLGNYIRIDHDAVQSIYGHLSRITVEPGQTISAGYPLGVTGKTGRATGEHLHFSIRRKGTYINPWRFLHGLIRHIDNEH